MEQKRSPSWPGTNLLRGEATVHRFSLYRVVLDEVIAATDGLFGWRQPELPEDLALLREDGTAVLASICHEHDAYLQLTDEEYERVVEAIPEIADMVRPGAGGS